MMAVRYNPRIHHRGSIRLSGYDYNKPGAYFVTICTQGRELFLADRLACQIVNDAWRDLARRFPSVCLDEFVVMPNHIHGIIWITRAERPVGAQHGASADPEPPHTDIPNSELLSSSNHAAPIHLAVQPGSLGIIVRAFKSRAAKRINRLRRTPNAPVWQRNYYEHIIRDEEDLARIRQYVIDNPARWADDPDNPAIRQTATSQQHEP